MTDDNGETVSGWIGYDSDCSFCCAWARRFRGPMLRRGFRFVSLQAPEARERLRLDSGAQLTEMRVRLADGQSLGGADAVVAVAGRLWCGRPLAMLARLPGAMPALRGAYRFLAAN